MKTVCNLLQIDLQSPLVLELSWLEHLTVNQRVAGSSPAGGAKADQKWSAFFIWKTCASPLFNSEQIITYHARLHGSSSKKWRRSSQ